MVLDKIFLTQLTGVLKRIQDEEEYHFEDSSRLLAQALVGEGSIYIWGDGELEAVSYEAIKGKDSLKNVKTLKVDQLDLLTDSDRVLLFSRNSTDENVIHVGHLLRERNIPFVAVASKSKEQEGIDAIADLFIDLKIKNGLVPTDTGERVGYPYLLVSLFVYHHLQFLVKEILDEYED